MSLATASSVPCPFVRSKGCPKDQGRTLSQHVLTFPSVVESDVGVILSSMVSETAKITVWRDTIATVPAFATKLRRSIRTCGFKWRGHGSWQFGLKCYRICVSTNTWTWFVSPLNASAQAVCLQTYGCGSKPNEYLLGRSPPFKRLFRVMGGTGFWPTPIFVHDHFWSKENLEVFTSLIKLVVQEHL